MRGRGSSIAGNPVLIGAATVLVIIVAVFLAYNANSGLPFVPTYSLNAQVPNAAQLVVGNDVRIGGTRVGAWTFIGLGAKVRDHIEVGAGAVVGMGAVVVGSIGNGEVVVGVPARRLEPRP